MDEVLPDPQRFSLALGLNRHPVHYKYPKGNPGFVTRFAGKVNDLFEVLAYPQLIERKGLVPATVGPELEKQIISFMEEAQKIHFQLDGMIARGRGRQMSPRQINSLRDSLALGMFGTELPRNITNWELYQTWNFFRPKTIYYWKRKVIDFALILLDRS